MNLSQVYRQYKKKNILYKSSDLQITLDDGLLKIKSDKFDDTIRALFYKRKFIWFKMSIIKK